MALIGSALAALGAGVFVRGAAVDQSGTSLLGYASFAVGVPLGIIGWIKYSRTGPSVAVTPVLR